MNIHLNQGIRSKSGLNLKEAVVRQVVANEQKPNVRFIGKGVIIPQSTQLSVPFQAIYLRGVTVSVIKILEQNIGQFLQSNNLDESGELMRVGRLITRKTIFLDEEGLDLSRWNTFAVDLKRLIDRNRALSTVWSFRLTVLCLFILAGMIRWSSRRNRSWLRMRSVSRKSPPVLTREGITIIASMIGLIIIGRNGVILARTVIILIRWRERMSWLPIWDWSHAGAG